MIDIGYPVIAVGDASVSIWNTDSGLLPSVQCRVTTRQNSRLRKTSVTSKITWLGIWIYCFSNWWTKELPISTRNWSTCWTMSCGLHMMGRSYLHRTLVLYISTCPASWKAEFWLNENWCVIALLCHWKYSAYSDWSTCSIKHSVARFDIIARDTKLIRI